MSLKKNDARTREILYCNHSSISWKVYTGQKFKMPLDYLGSLLSFYVLDNPISALGHELSDYGWKGRGLLLLRSGIEKLLNTESALLSNFSGFDSSADFIGSLKKYRFEDQNSCVHCERVVFMNSKGNYIKSFLAHLRNSFAHGLFYYDQKQRNFLFDDYAKGNLTMRAVLSVKTLESIKDLIVGGPQGSRK